MAVGEEDDVVIRMINSAAALRSETLDLGRKGLCEIPEEIMNLKHLESLHLEANYITELPEEFFERLTSLKWLDMRNNRLTTLPKSVGKHRCLRSLLLEGNSLTHLPCELGMSRSLCGLSLCGNPLEFPPPHIVKKGTQEVLKYLREMCEKSKWPEEKIAESFASDQESEDMDFTSGLEFPDEQNSSSAHSAGSARFDAENILRRVSSFKLPPIVRNATTVRRSNSDASDERGFVHGQTVKQFEPIRRSTWDAVTSSLNETMTKTPRKRRNKRSEEDGGFSENVSRKPEVMMEEAPCREEKISEKFKKSKQKKKFSLKKDRKVPDSEKNDGNNNLPSLTFPDENAFYKGGAVRRDDGTTVESPLEATARFSVVVGDMVAIKVPEKHFIKGQPCVGQVVAEADDRDQVLVHYYVGSYDGFFRPMMSRSSPYLRKVPLQNLLCKFEMQADGRLSPKTAIRLRQMVERLE